MRGVAHSLTVEELMGVADSAHGFTGSDLTTVCMQGKLLHFFQLCKLHVHSLFCLLSIAQHKALRRQLEEKGEGEGEEGEGEGGRCVVVRCEDVRSGLREVRPSAMREVTVEVPKVRTTFFIHFQIIVSFLFWGVVGVMVRHWWSGAGEEETERSSRVASQTP